MAKTGLVRAPEWWVHLRSEKRTFWKAERKAAKRDVEKQISDQ